jgi:hypothetical protein
MANARLYESWGSLTEALKTATLYADPDRLRGFLAAMTA